MPEITIARREHMHPGYSLPGDTYADWRDGEAETFAPTPRQALVVEAVTAALAAGLYYTVDVREFCARYLGITPEVDAFQRSQVTQVEGGEFGMDCYYARRYLDAQKKHAELRRFAEALRARPGDSLGTLVFSDFKRTNATCVKTVSECGRYLTITGKRGAATYEFQPTATQVAYAIDRAHSGKHRKDDFAGFAAKRA